MSGRVRVAGAVLAFVGIAGASALGAATALHVTLEHEHTHGLEALDRGHRHSGTATPHEDVVDAPDHGHAHQAEAPEHDHALALVANVERAGRVAKALSGAAHALATTALPLDAPSMARTRRGRAGPPARAAPLSRRSVVLQV